MEPDDLYGLPLDRFVAERAALAKALRADGRRAESSDVAGMRKPSVAAWAVNQLVRTQSRALQGLFGAGDALREAQTELLAGRGDGRALLRAAGERERAAVERLVDTARGLLTSQGQELSATVVERVADTLHAAALDEGAREHVREGRLERELRHVGLGLGESASNAQAAAPRAAKSKPRARKSAAARGPTETARGERERPARAAKQPTAQQRADPEQTAARKTARSAEASARRRSERAAHALRAAQERRDRAARALDEADDALAAAREQAVAATRAQQRAQAELEKI